MDTDATISINADLTDSAYIGAGLTYQWTLNGNVVTDGTVTTTTTTGVDVEGIIENTYTSSTPVSVPSSATNIEVTLAGAAGGNGGSDAGGPGGRGAQGRAGRFSMPNGAKDLDFYIGKRGNGGTSGGQDTGGLGGGVEGNGDGRPGGGAGQSGWSGGGGGGGAASYLTNNGSTILVSAGGGGGGGGSNNRAGDSGYNRNPGVGLGYGRGSVGSLSDGSPGTTKNGDGGGGGGGGGGAPGGSGGGAGQDNSHGGYAGSGGASAMDPAQVTKQGNGWLHEGDGYGYLKYTGYTEETETVTRNTVVSGTTSNTFTLRADIVGVQTAQCTVYHPDATNNPVISDEVTFVTVSDQAENNITVEAIGVTDTATISSLNLNNGEYTFNIEGTDVDNNGINQFYCFYSPDKDMEVELDLYGGKGADNSVTPVGNHSNVGGEGGYSRIRFTMSRNTEYIIAGLLSSINAPFLYRKGVLMACVGEGGGAGIAGNGGFGGGVDVGGTKGGGVHGGPGGEVVLSGNLGSNGIFGSIEPRPSSELHPGDSNACRKDTYNADCTNGGRTFACSKGTYWAQQGVAPCTDISGSTQFRLSDGRIVTNTASITRGYKAGYNIMRTAGVGGGGKGTGSRTKAGNGGNGTTGGNGGQDGTSGGGGGSGYQDGSITVVDTQLGGSTGDAKVVLRVVT